MARAPQVPKEPSLAEGSASAVENAFAPRLRTAFKNSSSPSDPTKSPSTQPSNASNKLPLDPTRNDSEMRPSEVLLGSTLAANLISLPLSVEEDYFGPIYHTPGEVIRYLFWPFVSAIIFGLLGFFTMVLTSICTIALIQGIKLLLDKRILRDLASFNLWSTKFGELHSLLYYVQVFLTIMMFLLQGILGFSDVSKSWYNIIFVLAFFSSFLLIQCIYWPLHACMLHATVTDHRPQNRYLMVESLDGAHRGYVPYNIGRFLLIFMGSGGHTTEELNLVKLMEPFDRSMFRRYVVTGGDQRSFTAVKEYERKRQQTFEEQGLLQGTYEIVWVSRARYVGQSWLTTPFTALGCVRDCYRILNLGRPLTAPGSPRAFPQTIVCNGPGSAAVFVWVSHLMRMYGAIPANRCATLFVESIARAKTLSLTGKIFYWLDLADAFIVQHEGVQWAYPDVVVEQMLVSRVYTDEDHVVNCEAEAYPISPDDFS